METAFGWIDIDGHRYENDVIIHVNGQVTKRKKKMSKDLKGEYGHTPLSAKELDFLSDERPKLVIIGAGQYGDLPITPEAREILDEFETVVLSTPEALELIEGEKSKKMVAIIHVTC